MATTRNPDLLLARVVEYERPIFAARVAIKVASPLRWFA
jgi:hypothetical protein